MTLPSALWRPRSTPARASSWGSTGAPPRRSRRCSTCASARSAPRPRGAPSNPDAVGARAATDSLLEGHRRGDRARRGSDASELDAAVLAIAGTDTDAVAAHVREHRPGNVGCRQRRRRSMGGRHRRTARAWGRSRAPAATCSGWARRACLARRRVGSRARRRGQRLLAGGASRSRPPSRPRALRPGDGAERAPRWSSSTCQRRGARDARLLQAARQGRDRRVRHRDGSCGPRRGRGGARLSTSAPPPSSAGRSRAVIEQTGLAGRLPGRADRQRLQGRRPVRGAARGGNRSGVAPQARVAVVEMVPVGGCLLLAARPAGGEQCRRPG